MALENKTTMDSPFLKACRREPAEHTPVWLMRQAGRYMAEYRKLREKYSILEMIRTPELACEVTMQPLRAFDLDAGIIFADILPPLVGMGLELEFVGGEGPVIHNPVRSKKDVAALTVRPAEKELGFTLEAIKMVRAELDPRALPLIGFSGAPFTLACYAIEGGSSKNFVRTKQMMYGEPETWDELMTKLSDVIEDYLRAQAEAGAQALQLFDSWVGQLSPVDYENKVMPYSKRILQNLVNTNVPLIHFGTNTNGMLELIRDAGGDVIGVDWRIPLGAAWERLGSGVAVQGNLDPVTLFAPWNELERHAQAVLDQAAGRAGHIFNLGHGILPETPVDNVKRLVDFIHQPGEKTS